jgi:hypothetical protein
MHLEQAIADLESQSAARSTKRAVTAPADVAVSTTALGHLSATEAVAPEPFWYAGGSLKKGGISIE